MLALSMLLQCVVGLLRPLRPDVCIECWCFNLQQCKSSDGTQPPSKPLALPCGTPLNWLPWHCCSSCCMQFVHPCSLQYVHSLVCSTPCRACAMAEVWLGVIRLMPGLWPQEQLEWRPTVLCRISFSILNDLSALKALR